MAEPLNCSISVRPRLKVGEPVELLFRLTNSTSETLWVLNWHTPLEGLHNNILVVTRDGTELEYRGMMKKRAPPDASSYVKLAPSASIEAKVELSESYDFTVPGKYTLAFPGPLMDVATKKADVPHRFGESRPREVRCTPVEMTIASA